MCIRGGRNGRMAADVMSLLSLNCLVDALSSDQILLGKVLHQQHSRINTIFTAAEGGAVYL